MAILLIIYAYLIKIYLFFGWTVWQALFDENEREKEVLADFDILYNFNMLAEQ